MTIQTFEDIVAWQKSRVLVGDIYSLFGPIKDFGFKDQITRASVSIMNNIAEGFDRGSNKDFAKFLIIARGSAAEVRSMLIIASDLNYLNDQDATRLMVLVKDISKLLTGFIKSLNR
jgi:four helix bundle protein